MMSGVCSGPMFFPGREGLPLEGDLPPKNGVGLLGGRPLEREGVCL